MNESINKVSQTTLNKQITIRHKSFSEKFQNVDNLEKLFTIEISDANNSLLSILKNDANIEYIQKALTYKVDEIPSDSLYSQQWGLQNIKAESAWDLVPQNSKKILLAVIDTGIDYLHPDLKNQIYINKGEVGIDQNGNDKKSNGIDDDKNGFIDDFQGWDFVNKINIYPANMKDDFTDWDNDPNDEHGHGTNIAGVIGAEHNTFGIAGVNPNIEIMNLRAFDKNGNGKKMMRLQL
ncbi:MAG: S8 family serine peptidase [Ignavibacteriales bacterium]|nr:S8 family serine peptidase [Ignavibacteriales bacterium]